MDLIRPRIKGDDPNSMWGSMNQQFTSITEKLCPLREYTIRKDRPEYFTPEISNQILNRDRLFKKSRNTLNRERRRSLWLKAISKRSLVRSLIRREKRIYITKRFNESRNNPKKYWRHMSNFLNRTKVSAPITNIVLEDGKKVKGIEAAEAVNNYFCEVGTVLARRIAPTTRKFHTRGLKCKFKWGFKLTEDEVQERGRKT